MTCDRMVHRADILNYYYYYYSQVVSVGLAIHFIYKLLLEHCGRSTKTVVTQQEERRHIFTVSTSSLSSVAVI